MNTKSMFAKYADINVELSTLKADIIAAKPWTLSAAGKAEIDATLVRVLAKRYGFSYGTAGSNAVYSGLAVKSPGKEALEASPRWKRYYQNVRKALHDARKLFDKPVEHAAASLTDKKHAEAKRLAKFTPEQVKAIVALAAKYRAE